MAQEQPSLGQLIWLVRRELEWAHEIDADQPLRFDVGSVEMDVRVEASRTTKGGGGLDLRVMGVGGSGELSRESLEGTTSLVHVVLTPVDTRNKGGRYQVSAVDIEPPPRRAEATGQPELNSAAAREAGLAARDGEPISGS